MLKGEFKIEEKESVVTLLSPLLTVSSIVGSYPISTKLELSWPLTVYSFGLTILLPFLVLNNWTFVHDYWKVYWMSNESFGLAMTIVTIIGFYVCVITIPFNVNNLRRCLFRLENIEYTFIALGAPIKWNDDFSKSTVYGLGGIAILFTCDSMMRYITYKNFLADNILYLMLGNYLCIISLTCSTLLFRNLFIFIKKYLEHCTLVFRERRNKGTTIGAKNSMRLRELLAVFESLCQVSCRVNRIFGLLTMTLTFQWFIQTVIVTYNFVNCLSKSEVDYFLFVNQFLTFGFLSLVLWNLIESVSDAANQAKQFTQTVYEIMISENNHLSKEEEELFKMHLSRKREISLMVCGLFPLDRTLAHSIFATATTYLVILIQFGDKDNETKEDQMSTSEYSNATTMISTTFD